MKKLGAGFLAVLLVVVILMIALCTAKVPAGYVGVKYKVTNGVADDTLSQGWHLVSPGVKVTLYTVGIEQSYLTSNKTGDSKDDESFEASTKEGKAITLDMTFTYQFDPEKVPFVFTKFKGQSGTEVRDSFIKPNIISWTKEVVATYKVAEIIGDQRAALNSKLSEYLAEKFEPYGIIISNASLINIDVDEETSRAINEKITAQQYAETQTINNQTAVEKAEADKKIATTNAEAEAEKMTIQAEAHANALMIEAQAQADANKLLSESLTPELIESQKIEKWNGKLPKITGTDNMIISVSDSSEEEE